MKRLIALLGTREAPIIIDDDSTEEEENRNISCVERKPPKFNKDAKVLIKSESYELTYGGNVLRARQMSVVSERRYRNGQIKKEIDHIEMSYYFDDAGIERRRDFDFCYMDLLSYS